MGTPVGLIIALVALLSLGTIAHGTKFEAVKKVGEKLEEFVLENKPSSGLTTEELDAALLEYQSWPQDIVARVRQDAFLRLIIDFAVHPIDLIGSQLTDDDEAAENYIRRLELAYKMFRPAYAGSNIDMDIPRAGKIMSLLGGVRTGQVTLRHFREALAEYNTWWARYEEITTFEDVYGCLKELKQIMNLMNYSLVQPLKAISPMITPKANPIELREAYLKMLADKYNMKLVDGNFVQYVKA